MSVIGINQYVLEDFDKEYYDFFISIFENYKNHGKPKDYIIGTIWGLTFCINREIQYEDGSVDYFVFVKDAADGEYLGASYIGPNDIRYDDGNIYLRETWEGLPGALERLFSEFPGEEPQGFYYMTSNEWDEAGITNDEEGRFFKRRCVIDTIEHTPDPDLIAKVIPEDFVSLPLEEQEAICKQYDIAYSVTLILSFNWYWELNRVSLE